MPEKSVIRRAHLDARRGRAASTQAGEFVREEMHHIRRGKHGARSTKQAIAIGLSKGRRAGVKLPAPKRGPAATREHAKRDIRKGRAAGRRRGHRSLSTAARKAARTNGHRGRVAAARKAARTRRMHRR